MREKSVVWDVLGEGEECSLRCLTYITHHITLAPCLALS